MTCTMGIKYIKNGEELWKNRMTKSLVPELFINPGC